MKLLQSFVKFRQRLVPPPADLSLGVWPGGRHYNQKINFILQTSMIAQIVAIDELNKLCKYIGNLTTIFHTEIIQCLPPKAPFSFNIESHEYHTDDQIA